MTYCFANGVSALNTANVAHGDIEYNASIFSSERCAKNSTNAEDDDDDDDDEASLISLLLLLLLSFTNK
jgi:hypothetical protein